MQGDPVIQTHELTKEYRHPFFTWVVRARALTDLTLSIGSGEVFGLLGPNGSGKSTTIKLLLGLIFPTSGRASVFGRLPSEQSIKRRIGFLPEESYLYRFLDAEETLDFYGRLFGLPRVERRKRIDALLAMTGLSRERHRPIAEFSKGMQRRVGLAQCLINDPDLIILDEPTTGMDPLGTREIKDLVLELKDKGKTILLSSHLLSDVEDVCDRVAILYGGKVLAAGALSEVLAQQSHTQITAEMSEDTAAAVAKLIREREGADKEVALAPPTERLENYFLRVVREAQSENVATSGVEGTSGTLEFLTQSEAGAAVLDELTRAEKPTATTKKEPDAAPVEALTDTRKVVLDQLTSASADEPAAEKTDAPDDAPRNAGKVDRSVLDHLTKDED